MQFGRQDAKISTHATFVPCNSAGWGTGGVVDAGGWKRSSCHNIYFQRGYDKRENTEGAFQEMAARCRLGPNDTADVTCRKQNFAGVCGWYAMFGMVSWSESIHVQGIRAEAPPGRG